jgi:hypothetical protein
MLEHLLQNRRGNHGPGHCKMAQIVKKLDQADADILNKVLEDIDEYSTHGIYQGLRESGIYIGYATVERHRKNLCVCGGPNA